MSSSPSSLRRGLAAVLVLSVGGMVAWLAAARPVAHAATAPPAVRCSRIPFGGLRSHTATLLIGTGTADTALAGAGSVTHDAPSGGTGAAPDEPIHGQVVRVDRVAGHGREAVEQAFARAGNREVVVVPWGYFADCSTAQWADDARWVDMTEPGFFALRLRAESQWAGERPTFDAFAAWWEPYPHAPFLRRRLRGTAAQRDSLNLTADELFDLRLALPVDTLMGRDPVRGAAMVDAWVRANPELAARYPATEILRWVRWSIERRR